VLHAVSSMDSVLAGMANSRIDLAKTTDDVYMHVYINPKNGARSWIRTSDPLINSQGYDAVESTPCALLHVHEMRILGT
jgi:hypothetical protein